MDITAELGPTVKWPICSKLLHHTNRAVEGYPRHHLGMNKVPARPADLPNSLIRLGPDCFKMIDECPSQFPAGLAFSQSLASGQIEGIEKLAIDIELQLSRGGIPDSYGPRGLVAG